MLYRTMTSQCSSCGAQLAASVRFCSCGQPAGNSDQLATIEIAALDLPFSAVSKACVEFVALVLRKQFSGLIAGRYRIIALPGRGGMGEVWALMTSRWARLSR